MQDSKHTKLGIKENTSCEEKIFSSSKTFANIMRNCDVRFYTGFINTEIFSIIIQLFKSQNFYYAILGWDKENFKD